MSQWEQIQKRYPTQHPLTEEEQLHTPLCFTEVFAAYKFGTRTLFALFDSTPVWTEQPNTGWRYSHNNSEVTQGHVLAWFLSQAQLAPSRVPAKSRTSPSKPALKPSYSHVVKQGLKTPTRDPRSTHVMKSHAPPVLQVSRVTPRDPGKQESRVTTRDPGKPGDLPRDWSSAWPHDVTRFRRVTRPLIGTWKTVGQSTVDRRINKVTRLTIVTHAQSTVNAAQH